MSIIIKLKGLPLEATSFDVRHYFLGLTIPDGGVHIVGGDDGTVFIEFASDEDARQAMARGDGTIKDSNIKLLLSSRAEMQSVTEIARQQQQKYLQEQQQQQQLQQHHNQQQPQPQQQLQQLQNLNLHQPSLGQQQSFVPSGLTPMGPAMLPSQQPSQTSVPFEGDPRILSQNYQGILNVINQQRLAKGQSQQQHQPTQLLSQQPEPKTTQPSSFADPRILSQSYQSMLPNLNQVQAQPLLPPQIQPIFNQFPPTTVSTNNNNLNMNLLGGVGMTGGALAPLNMNPLNLIGSGVAGGINGLNLAGQTVAGANLDCNNIMSGNNNGMSNVANVGAGNRNHSPDNRARMSGMRGGDDKLFANKRCVLAASNIPYRATSKDIIEFLSEFNIKEDCIRRRYNQKGQPTADAKIAFPTPDAAMKAMKMMNKKNLCGRPVFLKPV